MNLGKSSNEGEEGRVKDSTYILPKAAGAKRRCIGIHEGEVEKGTH